MKPLYLLLFYLIAICSITGQIVVDTQTVSSTTVYFDFAEFTIREDATFTLNELIASTKGKEGYFIRIATHTDAIGSDKSNLELSERRAQAIKAYLLDNEMMPDTFLITTNGEHLPIEPNTTDAGRQKNRRATIQVLKLGQKWALNGLVLEEETTKGIAATVVIRNKHFSDTIVATTEGQFSKNVPLNEVIGLDIWAEGYLSDTRMLKTTPAILADLKIYLSPIKKGSKFDINNFYFEGGKDILLEKSKPELFKILKFMEMNKSIKIEIAGHVNVPNQGPIPRSSSSFVLSLRRALVVYNYLLENGIAADRLSYKGYGNWEMKYPNAISERAQAANRRVEIRIVDLK